MARRPKPWWWSQGGEYCVTIDGIRHRLGPDKDTAETKFHTLMSKPDSRVPSNTVVAVVDLFLDWTQKHRDHLTYVWYRNHLQRFADSLKSRITVDRLKAHHVESWVDAQDWGDTYKRGAITAVSRCMNWALKKGHIDTNPIYKKLEKPAAGRREVHLTPKQFRDLLKHLKGDFRDLVVVAWETGCRPQEIRKVEARHVDLKNGRWVFPEKESKGKKSQRVVYLSGKALETTKRLMAKYPKGPLFRRSGKQWTPCDASQYFLRLKKKVGVRYRLYDFRFSFCTNGLKNGVDPITMQHLMGHKDLSMISRIYGLVSQDVGHMRKAATKAACR